MAFKLTETDDYDRIDIRLINFPHAFKAKCEEYVKQGIASNMEEAKEMLADCVIELELFYDIENGLFGVESEAIESASEIIVSPYTGQVAESTNEGNDEETEEEKEHICPNCGSTNTRYYMDITDCGDVHGWLCNDCGFDGDEDDFLEK